MCLSPLPVLANESLGFEDERASQEHAPACPDGCMEGCNGLKGVAFYQHCAAGGMCDSRVYTVHKFECCITKRLIVGFPADDNIMA